MCAVNTSLGAGVSYEIFDLKMRMMSVVRWIVPLKFLEDKTRK